MAARIARSVRSNAQPSRRPEAMPAHVPISARPQLKVIQGGRLGKKSISQGIGRLAAWLRARTAPMVHVVVAIAFLMASLLGALALRTQMVQHSFEASEIQANISELTQDVTDDQAKLDGLEATLPQKASDLGMVPQSSSVTIDLNGYKPSEGMGK